MLCGGFQDKSMNMGYECGVQWYRCSGERERDDPSQAVSFFREGDGWELPFATMAESTMVTPSSPEPSREDSALEAAVLSLVSWSVETGDMHSRALRTA